jgi:hypothetical protein
MRKRLWVVEKLQGRHGTKLKRRATESLFSLICIFDAQIGELLGIDVKSGKAVKVAGITGAVENYFIHRVKIIVGGWDYGVSVGFLPNIARLGYGVVGQNGFFDIFVVKFDLLKEEIELRARRK